MKAGEGKRRRVSAGDGGGVHGRRDFRGREEGGRRGGGACSRL